jgi:hypothetical protein
VVVQPQSHPQGIVARAIYAWPVSATARPASSRRLDPASITTFRFVGRSIGAAGTVSLRYALDDVHEFEERMRLPRPATGRVSCEQTVEGLLDLLHWVAGVSYYKAAAPPTVAFESGTPPPATARLLETLYSEGLGEFAAVNEIPVPSPSFRTIRRARGRSARFEEERPGGAAPGTQDGPDRAGARVLVPVGGGKDSAVAIEIVRRAGIRPTLFSVGAPPPIAGTVRVAALPWLLATRRIDPHLLECNAAGALNGHVPVTAIVACVALLTAALAGIDTVALANERSASSHNTVHDGVEINHQFSKSARAERFLRAAADEVAGAPMIFSVLRPASELAIARSFARMPQYHRVFTSCNAVFRVDPSRRERSWCRNCDKCRFVFLMLAPFMEPRALSAIFGADLLVDESQYMGFASLTGTGAHKPFECVGEERESAAAIALLAGDPRWKGHPVVRRLAREVLPRFDASDTDAAAILALGHEHWIPPPLIGAVDAVLGA